MKQRTFFRTGVAVCCGVTLFGCAARARAQGDSPARSILPEVVDSSYRGRKVVIDFSRLTPQITSLIVLREPGGRERREMTANHGVIITDGVAAWRYFPERRIVVRRPVRRVEGTDTFGSPQLEQALRSYEVRGATLGEVAGRQSRLLEFWPRQPGSRPLRKVWIDVATGLVLRTEIYNLENRLSWLSVFEALEYGLRSGPEAFTMRIPPGVRVMEEKEERCFSPEEAEQASGLPLGVPQYLPVGFERTCIHARRHHDFGEMQMLFSDGLSLLSLFESTHFREPGGGGSETPVAVGPWPGRWYDLGLVTALAWGGPGMYFALLGEVSRDELHKVAVTVRTSGELLAPSFHQRDVKVPEFGR